MILLRQSPNSFYFPGEIRFTFLAKLHESDVIVHFPGIGTWKVGKTLNWVVRGVGDQKSQDLHEKP